MRVHLIDGTYELFRHYFAMPSYANSDGEEIAAVRGVLSSMERLIADGATHLAVATDHVIESFRNELWDGYKAGDGIEPELYAQFPWLESGLRALGIEVWAMVREEADDGLAAGAAMATRDPRVEEVLICTPDKDLAQCVEGSRVVMFDRRKLARTNEQGVWDKFGVAPASIPDYLALVGDTADGFPGLPGWGAKSASTVLGHYGHLEAIPDDGDAWAVKPRGRDRLAKTLAENRELAQLFRRIATVERSAPVSATVDEIEWRGVSHDHPEIIERLDLQDLHKRLEERFHRA